MASEAGGGPANKSNRKLHHPAAVIYDVDYTMHRSTVIDSLIDGNVFIGLQTSIPSLDNLTGTMIGQMLYTSLYDFKDGRDPEQPFYDLLLSTLAGEQSLDRFLDAETLRSSGTQVWEGLSAYFVRDNLLQSASVEQTTIGTYVEDRLRISGVSLWLMVTGFVLMAALTLCIALTTDRSIVSYNIGLLSTEAATLAASQPFQELLERSGRLRTSQLTSSLRGYNFATSFQHRFHIMVTSKEKLEQRHHTKPKVKAWTPLAVRYPIVLLTMAVPLISIVVLEILYRMSVSQSGLVDIAGSEEVTSYTSRYVSVAVLLLVATCFSGLDFDIALFLPYSRLRSGPLPAVLPNIASIRLLSDTPAAFAMGESANQNYTLQLDGLRPNLSCEIIADEYILNYTRPSPIHDNSTAAFVSPRPRLPPGCQHAGPFGNESNYNFSIDYPQFDEVRTPFVIGKLTDLHLGPFAGSYGINTDGFDEFGLNENQLENPAGCPSLGAIFARVDNLTVQTDEVTALLCSQMIQQIRLNVTDSGLDLNKAAISVQRPPVPTVDSVTNLTDGTDGFDTFPYGVQTYLGGPFGNLTSFSFNDSAELKYRPPLNMFMEHILQGPNGTAAENLLGRENRQAFKEAVQDLYARYMRLVIDMRFRQPIAQPERSDGSAMDGAVVGGTVYSFTSRLTVDRASKLALQAMPGAMTILGTLAFAVADLRGTLPRKPSSIASRMALLTSSDMCREYAADHQPDVTSEGWLFSLGWWRESDRHAEQSERVPCKGGAALGKYEGEPQARRFGIDIGVSEQLGFSETKWWALRRRLRAGSSRDED